MWAVRAPASVEFLPRVKRRSPWRVVVSVTGGGRENVRVYSKCGVVRSVRPYKRRLGCEDL